jgi:hypothetical protein
MKGLNRLTAKCVLSSALAIVGMLTAGAAQSATCPGAVTISGLYELPSNYEASGVNTTCINFSGTGTVDLKGRTITTASNGPATAIQCSGDIEIRDSGDPTTGAKGKITGTFQTGLKNCHKIDGVRIIGGTVNTGISTFISAGYKYIRNSLVEVSGTGMYGHFNNQSIVENNRVIANNTGIEVDTISFSPGLVQIVDNYISTPDPYGIASFAADVEIANNWIDSQITSGCIYTTQSNTVTGNYCDCAECDAASADADPYEYPTGATAACPGTVSGNVVLTADYDLNATSGNCFNISAAYTTIDLNGHMITNGVTGGTAINCTGTGTSVIITDSTKLGSIRSRDNVGAGFATGIAGCRTISNLAIKDVDKGVTNSSTANGLDSLTSTVISATTAAVDTYAERRASTITGNKFQSDLQGVYLRGVGAVGTGKVDIDDNVFAECHQFAVSTPSSNVNVHNNIMYGRDSSQYSPSDCLSISGAASSRNLCDCPADCPDTTEPPIIYPF